VSLGVLIAAPNLLDLLWPIFLLLGWERVAIVPGKTAFTPLDFISYPITHSLLGALGWATLFAVLYYSVAKYKRGAIVIWIGVVSHWFLDLIVHRPDLPIYPGGPRLGLGLWNSPVATVVIEDAMYLAGMWIYLRATRAKDGIGRYGFLSFAAVILLVYIAIIAGPPPSDVKTLAIATLFSWLFVIWAWWFDRHREVMNSAS
jgi:LexA-binding, inner membrane-associated putative hydrolase